MGLTTIEKLNEKYFKITGQSPEYGFWSWLESMGIDCDEKELKKLIKAEELWDEMKEKKSL